MVGRLEVGGRIAAAALLALGSLAPLNGPLLAASVAPVADTSIACAVTVGTATTDPALAADAARAIAVGYAATDCLPDAQLLAAAEARAAIPMTSSTTTPTATPTAASSPLGGSWSSGSGTVAPIVTTTTTEAPATSTTSTPATTDTTETGTTETGTTETATTDDDGSSSDRSDSGTSPNDSEDPDLIPDDNPDPTVDGTTTAAGKLSWGTATGVEDFDGDLTTNWSIYDGPGHAGNGRRSPSAMSVSGGVFTITGDANGTTGGMAWKQGRSQYGRWEARVKSPVADPSYNAVMLLWPNAENWPVGGEVDFMEIGDETRQEVDFFLHYGEDNSQLHDQVTIDATQWHNWAVEWAPGKITGYVDGEPWFSTTQASALPPGPMHLTLQLDWFPKGGSVQQSTMDVDWVRYYPIDGSGASAPPQNVLGGSEGNRVTLAPSTGTGTTGGTDSGTDTDDTAATPTSDDTATDDTATADAAPVVTDLEGDSNATDGGGADGSGADGSGADGTASTGSAGSGSTTAAG